MALVIVLAFLALISVLMLAFFSSVQTELQSSRVSADSATVKQLVNSTTGLVMSQITDGTLSTDVAVTPANPAASGKRLTWASQPGMIRTWDDTGKPAKAFKLYSAKDMVLTLSTTGYSASAKLNEEVPATWYTDRALFTDLNQPAQGLDPASSGSNSVFTDFYPILDPGVSADKIDGFKLNPPPGKSPNAAAMPVRWMYLLKDGTFTVPSESTDGGLTATWQTAAGLAKPTQDNPIVGRVAFWTDDESAKLNVNTASEGTPWDTPRALCLQDLQYGQFQPVQKEFQRYPGHPFGVCLSPVLFPGIKPINTGQREAIYGAIPRVVGGGTKGGTATATAALVPDSDRLFANVDEFLFNKDRTLNTLLSPAKLKHAEFFLTANSRAPEVNLFGLPRVSMWPESSVATARTPFDKLAAFCSTIGDGSKSANTYYFQRTPSGASSQTDDYDSVKTPRNVQLYQYLQRITGSAVPGYGGSFLNKYGDDRNQILTEIFDYIRATNLRDPQWDSQQGNYYAPIGQVVPITIGNAASPQVTRGFGRFHSLSQFGMHFICSQQVVNDPDKNSSTYGTPINMGILGKNAGYTGTQRLVEAAFLLEPFSPGLGYYRLLENMSFDVKFSGGMSLDGQSLNMNSAFVGLNQGIPNGYHNNGRDHGGTGGVRGPVTKFFIDNPNKSDPIKNIYAFTSATRAKVGSGGGQTMSFSGGSVTIDVYSGPSKVAANLIQTFNISFPPSTLPLPELVQDLPASQVSVKIERKFSPPPANNPIVDSAGQASPVGYATDVYRSAEGENASNGWTRRETWWTFSGYQFAGATYKGRYNNAACVPQAPGAEYRDPARRWAVEAGQPGFKVGGLFHRADVLRTVVPDHGDIRLIAAQKVVGSVPDRDPLAGTPQNGFVSSRTDASGKNYRFNSLFHNVSGSHFMFGFSNEPSTLPITTNPNDIPASQPTDQLTASANVTYHYSRMPEIRAGAGKAYNLWGDFDNGPAQWPDGAYINKPDEGNVTSTNSPYKYWSWDDTQSGNQVTAVNFSANRILPSSGMLGSLPTGVKRNKPWQTLLFRPEVKRATGSHTLVWPPLRIMSSWICSGCPLRNHMPSASLLARPVRST